jgi:LacI family transcriptional regulator
MTTQKHVAVLVETSHAYGRRLLQGICKFQQQHGKWLTFFKPARLGDAPMPWLKQWKGDGILVRIETPEMAEFMRAVDVPVINLRSEHYAPEIPFLGVNETEVAEMAAEHLIERGIKQFAFVSEPSNSMEFNKRRSSFIDKVTTLGFPVEEFAINLSVTNYLCVLKERQRLADWLRDQPRPLGVFSMNDLVGLRVLDACRLAGLDVPEDVAVLGVDNDECMCNLSIPPLSSIDIQGEHAGYAAAAWLDAMMKGKTVPPPVAIKPRHVVTRHSTDILFANDPLVGKALQLIGNCAHLDWCSDHIFSQLKVSKVMLNSRFKNAIGRTVHEQIRRVRIQKAMERITNTSDPLKSVAALCGFQTVQYFTRVFREMTGETPAAFRAERKGLMKKNLSE